MSNFLFNEQYYFNNHRTVDAVIAEYPCLGPRDSAADPLQIIPDIYCPPRVTHENDLSSYGMYGLGSDWPADLSICPSATNTPNQIDTRFFNTSFPHQFPPSDSVVLLWQPPTSHHPSVTQRPTSAVGDDIISHSCRPLTLPESRSSRKPTTRSLSRHVNASQLRARSLPPRSLRYTPYAVGPDKAMGSASAASVHQCHWSDGARPCGAVVTGTKNAIGKHLQTAHAIRLKADKTLQACHWDKCRKLMRRESIPRHVLAVHLQDKVLCTICGSHFARTDSLQRHQRTLCLVNSEVSVACKVGE